MLSLNIILSVLLLVAIGLTTYLGYMNYRRRQLNIQMGEDLDIVLQSTIALIKKNEAAAKLIPQKIEDLYKAPKAGNDFRDIDSPQMLSTIVTVIIKKYGNLRLSLTDFTSVMDEDYISVYVDTRSKELILSLNHALGEDDPITMANFNPSDDNTFH